MTLPEAVRAQAERANALMDQAAGNTPPDTPPAAEGTTPPAAEVITPKDPPADVQPVQDVTPSPTPPTTDQSDSSSEWEHRYKSMRGRYEASERGQQALAEQLRIANQELEALRAQAAGLNEASNSVDELRLEPLTEDEVAEYGQDVVDMVRRTAATEAARINEKSARRIAELEAQVKSQAQTTEMTARASMLKTLDDTIPDWRTINEDPEFLNWLEMPDPLSGQVRRVMIRNQFNRNNAYSVGAFFTSFLKETGKAPEAPKEPQPEGKIPLESFAAPGRPQPAAPANGPTDKPIISRQQVADFYNARSRGEFRGREEEADRMEAAIFAAQADGRVR